MEPSGWNTCEKLVAPSAMPQSRMDAATAQGKGALRNVRALRQGTVEAPRVGTRHRIQDCTLFSPFFVLGPGRILEEVTRLAILGKVLRTRKHEQLVVRQHRTTPEQIWHEDASSAVLMLVRRSKCSCAGAQPSVYCQLSVVQTDQDHHARVYFTFDLAQVEPGCWAPCLWAMRDSRFASQGGARRTLVATSPRKTLVPYSADMASSS
jgi:hypothetical protein